jgi:hypothetical protein
MHATARRGVRALPYDAAPALGGPGESIAAGAAPYRQSA